MAGRPLRLTPEKGVRRARHVRVSAVGLAAALTFLLMCSSPKRVLGGETSSAAPAQDADASASSGLKLTADFPNGSLGSWQVTGPDTVQFTLSPASGGLWFHFRIDGVKGRTVTFVVPMTRNLSALTAHYYDERNRPAFSYDREKWDLAKAGHVDVDAKTFTFTIPFAENTAWVAYTIPYTNADLDKLLKEYAGNPYLRVRTLATTAEGRPVRWLTISDEPELKQQGGRHTVWVVARENGWEAPASWAADGLVRLALADDNLSQEFRKRLILQIVPILSPDAVAGGWMLYPTGGGKQTWLSPNYRDEYPEAAGLKKAIREWMVAGNTVEFAVRMQSSGWMLNQHQFFEELYLPEEQVIFDGLSDRLQRFVPQVRWVRLHTFLTEGFVEFCFNNFQTKGGTLTLSLGAKGNEMHKADLQDVGRALGEVLLSLYVPRNVNRSGGEE